MPELKDVVGVNLKTKQVRLMAEGETEDEAAAVMKSAVMLRGVDVEFFAVVPAGKYRDGDQYKGR